MNENRKAARGRRKHGHGRIYKTVSVVIILALIVLSMSIFFKVEKIEVKGISVCSEEEIIAASGVKLGDNLIFFDRFDAVNGIFKATPYIKEATITRRLPSTLVIGIVESKAIASVRIGESVWLLDSGGKLLEKTTRQNAAGTITISGVMPLAPAEGEKISLGEDGKAKREYLVQLLGLLADNELCADITTLDMSATTDVTFDYLGRFTVRLGQDDNLADKLSMLRGVVAELGEYDIGEIDLSTLHEAHFIPK